MSAEFPDISRHDEVADPRKVRPQLLLLGAGASRASFPLGDAAGARLPVMTDFFEHVPVGPLLDRAGVPWRDRNFEDVYSSIASDPLQSGLRIQLEAEIERYFSALRLPEAPTLYDYMVLSLRAKDVIATFNWDPFLIQAYRRSLRVTRSLPFLAFLHGNVAHGFCDTCKVSGVRGAICSRCNSPFRSDSLLFPVRQKDYSAHPSIEHAWSTTKAALGDSLLLTIFGYGAPASDTDAVSLMRAAWGTPLERQFEEIELIDIREEEEVAASWSSFIHTHHYNVHRSYHESFLASHPRRSVEAFHNQFIDAGLTETNPAPRNVDLRTLHSWFAELTDAEMKRGV